MSQQLINHSEDLQRLLEQGLVMDIKNDFLFINRIPYLNSALEVKYGVLVTRLQLMGHKTQPNPEHTVYFQGEMPCKLDGRAFNIVVNHNPQVIADGFKVDFHFSSKPRPNGYTDYFHKMMTYINMIASPAKAIDEKATEKGKQIDLSEKESVFNYSDTNSNKPELRELVQKFEEQKVAIVGVGGTGSYILDLVSKVPVKEIHLFDGDYFYNNNAFRSPGAASIDDLINPQKKTEYLKSIYSRMHKNIFSHPHYLMKDDFRLLLEFDFVFLNIDKGEIKKKIIEFLQIHKISFIDSGIGVEISNGALTGLLRNTTGKEGDYEHFWNSPFISYKDNPENEYSSNIQIGELNLLNAGFAVLKWKKMRGFYHDLTKEHNMFYRINANKIQND